VSGGFTIFQRTTCSGYFTTLKEPGVLCGLFSQCRVGAKARCLEFLASTGYMDLYLCDFWWGFGSETTQLWLLVWKSTRKCKTFNQIQWRIFFLYAIIVSTISSSNVQPISSRTCLNKRFILMLGTGIWRWISKIASVLCKILSPQENLK